MGISFGDILGAGIVGAAGGAGQAIYTDAEQQQQQAMLALRDQRLSQLRISEHAANVATDTAALPAQLQARSDAAVAQEQALASVKAQEAQTTSDIAVNQANRMPRVMSPGSTLYNPGSGPQPAGFDDAGDALDASGNVIPPGEAQPSTFTAPTRLTPEQLDYYQSGTVYRQAMADRAKAEADAINSGQRYGGKGANHPNVTVLDKDQGLLKDSNSGAIGIVVPGKPGKPAVSHMFGADEPAQPPTPQTVQWYDNTGKPLQNGLDDLYPQRGTAGVIKGAMGGGAPSGTAGSPSRASTGAIPSGIAHPTTQADYNALPKGSAYINPADGRLYTKN